LITVVKRTLTQQGQRMAYKIYITWTQWDQWRTSWSMRLVRWIL